MQETRRLMSFGFKIAMEADLPTQLWVSLSIPTRFIQVHQETTSQLLQLN